MQRKIFHQLNQRVLPEKEDLEFPIGKALEQSLQDKEQESIKVHLFASLTSSTPASATRKKGRKPQYPKAVVQPHKKMLKNPEFKWPVLTFFFVTF